MIDEILLKLRIYTFKQQTLFKNKIAIQSKYKSTKRRSEIILWLESVTLSTNPQVKYETFISQSINQSGAKGSSVETWSNQSNQSMQYLIWLDSIL